MSSGYMFLHCQDAVLITVYTGNRAVITVSHLDQPVLIVGTLTVA
jgi:hypothetical protein